MLKELTSPKNDGKSPRRWFSDDYFDLILWLRQDGSLSGFQLCYDKKKQERALTWSGESGFRHEAVDQGETNPAKNRSPILVPDGLCPISEITSLFLARSSELEPSIRSFIETRLREYEMITQSA